MARTKVKGAIRGGRKEGRANISPSSSPHETTTQAAQVTTNLHPLLTLQNEHRLKGLIDGMSMGLVVRHGYQMPPWNSRYEPYLRLAGFMGVQQIIGDFKWDDGLICAFVERWRPETHTFHLLVGEMTITLEDVSVLLGLPIHGTSVSGVTDMPWTHVVEQYLGKIPEGRAMANKSALSLNWLKENFSDLPDDAPEEQVEKYARAYLLSLMGSVLFVDLTGDSVSCIYLPLLADFNHIGTYAWRAAVLARLYRQLCHGSKKDAKQLGDCLVLLQMWVWERFISFRPNIVKMKVLQGHTPDTMPPRGFYWSGKHFWSENKRGLERYRQLIDLLQDENVEWVPYSPEILSELPPACMIHSRYWLSTAALIDFAIIETYHPDRVMQQFALYQVTPHPDRSTLRDIHAIDRQRFPRKDWREYHMTFIDEWTRRDHTIILERRSYDPESLAAYLQWYNAATIPTFASCLGLSTDGQTTRERLHQPELRFRKMLGTVNKFAKKAARHIKHAMEPRFAAEAFKVCRTVVGTVDSIVTFDRALQDIGEDTTEEESGEGSIEESGDGSGGEEARDESAADVIHAVIQVIYTCFISLNLWVNAP